MLSTSRNQTQHPDYRVKYAQTYRKHEALRQTKYYTRWKSVAQKAGFYSRGQKELTIVD